MLRPDRPTPGERGRDLEGVRELAYVARPRVAQQSCQRFGFELRSAGAELGSQIGQERAEVPETLAERRKLRAVSRETRDQVRAQIPAGHELFGREGAGRNEAHAAFARTL